MQDGITLDCYFSEIYAARGFVLLKCLGVEKQFFTHVTDVHGDDCLHLVVIVVVGDQVPGLGTRGYCHMTQLGRVIPYQLVNV